MASASVSGTVAPVHPPCRLAPTFKLAQESLAEDRLPRQAHDPRPERDLAGAAYEDGDLVFCDELGRPHRPKWLTPTLRKAAGIPSGSLHVLRHTAATLALTADPPVPLHIVAGRLGDDPTILLGVYAHLLPRSDAQAAEALAGILGDKPVTTAAT